MDTKEHSDRIVELEKQLKDKQNELDGVLTKHAALQLKNIAGLGGQVEELTSVNEQLAAAKEKMGQIEQKVGSLVALERQLEVQQEEIVRLKEENSNLRSQKSSEIIEPNAPQEVSIDIPEEPPKTAFQKRIERMHNESLYQEIKEPELGDNQVEVEEQKEKSAEQAVPEVVLEEEEQLAEQEEEENIEHDGINAAQSEEICSPDENISPPVIEEKIESAEQTNFVKELSPNKEIESDLLPDDVLKKWLGT